MDQFLFIGYIIGIAICVAIPFAYLEYEPRIEAIFRRFKRVLQQGIVDILNWFESFKKHK